MNKDRIKQIVAEEVKRQRKRLFLERGVNPLEPNAPQPQPQQQQPQQAQQPQQQAAPAPEPTNAAPGLNPNKAKGIIAGAIKTLMNSGALQGVGPEQVDAITMDIIKNLQTTVPTAEAPAVDDSQEDEPEFDDQVAHDKEANELDDQNQYDPDLDKQVSKPEGEEEVPAPEEEEPMFEVNELKEAFGMQQEVETGLPQPVIRTAVKFLKSLTGKIGDDVVRTELTDQLKRARSEKDVRSIIVAMEPKIMSIADLDPRYKKLMQVISRSLNKPGGLFEALKSIKLV
ncbi:MAG: hypothetical protein ACXACA_03380 [Candidatus Ranarchaeia archaeon]|jgi:hypothetical protein